MQGNQRQLSMVNSYRPIPLQALDELSQLRNLAITDSVNLTGSRDPISLLPLNISTLGRLTALSLAGNGLTRVPPRLEHCTALRCLDLSRNRLLVRTFQFLSSEEQPHLCLFALANHYFLSSELVRHLDRSEVCTPRHGRPKADACNPDLHYVRVPLTQQTKPDVSE